MTSDAVSVVQFVFGRIWWLFTSWYIPGTNVSPAMFSIFLLVASFGLRWLISLGGGVGRINSQDMKTSIRASYSIGSE